jgi:diguanylate cyclase (GGDEF)-like protein
VIVLACTETVTLDEQDTFVLELLASQAVSVLRATMLVPSLRRHAATDPLTGLGHHGAFSEALAGRSTDGGHALILVDVDHFKQCNDRHGHREGDRVLQAVARALSGVLREADTVFRIGGDEFAALVAVNGAADALELGRRMHDAVVGAEAGISVSVGIAVARPGEPDTELRDRADAALYRVKAAGRDGVAVDDTPSGPLHYDVAA